MAKLVTGRLRTSFVNLEEPNALSEKYQVDLLIPKNGPEVKKIKGAIKAAIGEGVEKKWNGKKPANLHNPLKDGDERLDSVDDPSKYAVYEGHYYITPKAAKPSQFFCFDRERNTISPEEIYSGCSVRASIDVFPYAHEKGGKGVSISLKALQFVADGEPVGSGRSEDSLRGDFDDDFDDFDDDGFVDLGEDEDDPF